MVERSFGRSSDKLTIQLTYFGQRERHKLLAMDGSPTDQPYESLRGLVSGGEFGSMLFEILDPASAAEFQWKSFTTIAKRHASTYTYRITRANSHHTVGYRTDAGEPQRTPVGQQGVIVLDGETSKVLRLTFEATEIPTAFAGLKATNSVEYAFINVAGRPYLLPVHAESGMSRPHLSAALSFPPNPSGGATHSYAVPPPFEFQNVVSFVGYRKFSADSSIDFSASENNKKKIP
jgi:hypothetical protein